MNEMTPDALEDLLRRADAAAGPPPDTPADLARRVRHLALRRRRVIRTGRRFGAAAAVLVAAIGVTLLWSRSAVTPRPDQVPAAVADTADLYEQIARLQTEADVRIELVRRTLAVQQRAARVAELERELARPDPFRSAQTEVEKTASILVHQADQLQRTLSSPEVALATYRRTIELFPRTHSAQIARARLAELKTN